MPWEHCSQQILDDSNCPRCGLAKSEWTMHVEQTRLFVLKKKRATKAAEVKLRLYEPDGKRPVGTRERYRVIFSDRSIAEGELDAYGFGKQLCPAPGAATLVLPARSPAEVPGAVAAPGGGAQLTIPEGLTTITLVSRAVVAFELRLTYRDPRAAAGAPPRPLPAGPRVSLHVAEREGARGPQLATARIVADGRVSLAVGEAAAAGPIALVVELGARAYLDLDAGALLLTDDVERRGLHRARPLQQLPATWDSREQRDARFGAGDGAGCVFSDDRGGRFADGCLRDARPGQQGTPDAPWQLEIDFAWDRVFVELRHHDAHANRTVPLGPGLLLGAFSPERVGASTALGADGLVCFTLFRRAARSALTFQLCTPEGTALDLAAAPGSPGRVRTLGRAGWDALAPDERWRFYPLPEEWLSAGQWARVGDAVWPFAEAIVTKRTAAAPGERLAFHLDDFVVLDLVGGAGPDGERRLERRRPAGERLELRTHAEQVRSPDAADATRSSLPAGVVTDDGVFLAEWCYTPITTSARSCTRLVFLDQQAYDLDHVEAWDGARFARARATRKDGIAGARAARPTTLAGGFRLRLENERGLRVPEARYEALLADGTERAGALDAQGEAVLPAAPVRVVYPDPDDVLARSVAANVHQAVKAGDQERLFSLLHRSPETLRRAASHYATYFDDVSGRGLVHDVRAAFPADEGRLTCDLLLGLAELGPSHVVAWERREPELSPDGLSNARWSADHARGGAPVELLVESRGLPEGTPVSLMIYDHDTTDAEARIATLSAAVAGGQVRATWTCPEERPGKRYHFVADAGRSVAGSPPLRFRDDAR